MQDAENWKLELRTATFALNGGSESVKSMSRA